MKTGVEQRRLPRADVLYMAHGYPPTENGGTELYTKHIAEAVSKEMSVAAIVTDKTVAERRVESINGVTVIRLPAPSYGQFAARSLWNGEYNKQIRGILADVRPSVAHVMHVATLSGAAMEELQKAAVPYYVHIHDYWFLCPHIQLLHAGVERCSGPDGAAKCQECFRKTNRPIRKVDLSDKWHERISRPPLVNALPHLLATQPPIPRSEAMSRAAMEAEGLLLSIWAPYFKGLLMKAEKIFAPSRFVRDLFLRHDYPPESVEEVSEGVRRLPALKPREGEGIRFGFFGNVSRIKGAGTVVEAFTSLDKNLNASLSFYGRAPEGEGAAAFERAGGRIHFRGPYGNDEISRVMGEVDMVIVPSMWDETFNIVAREAVMSGRPVIASSVGALTDFIAPGVNGRLFKAGDAAELARIMKEYARDKNLERKLSESAAKWAANGRIPTIDSNADYFASLYRRHVKSGAAAHADLASFIPPGANTREEAYSGVLAGLAGEADRLGYDFKVLSQTEGRAALSSAGKVLYPHLTPVRMYKETLDNARGMTPGAVFIGMTKNIASLDGVQGLEAVWKYDNEWPFGLASARGDIERMVKEEGLGAVLFPVNPATIQLFNGYREALGASECLGFTSALGMLPGGVMVMWTRRGGLSAAVRRFVTESRFMVTRMMMWFLKTAGAKKS